MSVSDTSGVVGRYVFYNGSGFDGDDLAANANNYFEGLDGRADGAISISAGVPNPELYEHFLVRNAVIAHNTIVNVDGAAITFDQGLGSRDRTLLAEDVTIANNLISSTLDPLFEGAEGNGFVFEGNIGFGQSLGSKAGDPGITFVDPQLEVDGDGIFRIDSSRPNLQSISVLTPSPNISVADLDGDMIRITAYRTILPILLAFTLGGIDRNDDFLATGIANVTGFVVHCLIVLCQMFFRSTS